MSMSVMINDDKQAIFFSEKPWPYPLPDTLVAFVKAKTIEIYNKDKFIGDCNISSASSLMICQDFFLGGYEDRKAVSIKKVKCLIYQKRYPNY